MQRKFSNRSIQMERVSLAFDAALFGEVQCEVRPRKDHLGVDLISDALPFGRLWYHEPNAVSNAKKRSNQMAATDQCADHQSNLAGISHRYSV